MSICSAGVGAGSIGAIGAVVGGAAGRLMPCMNVLNCAL